MTSKEYRYLYGQLTDADSKLPNAIYRKVVAGEELTKEEELIISESIQKDMRKEGS